MREENGRPLGETRDKPALSQANHSYKSKKPLPPVPHGNLLSSCMTVQFSNLPFHRFSRKVAGDWSEGSPKLCHHINLKKSPCKPLRQCRLFSSYLRKFVCLTKASNSLIDMLELELIYLRVTIGLKNTHPGGLKLSFSDLLTEYNRILNATKCVLMYSIETVGLHISSPESLFEKIAGQSAIYILLTEPDNSPYFRCKVQMKLTSAFVVTDLLVFENKARRDDHQGVVN